MFANFTGIGNGLAQRACAQYAVKPGGFRRFTHLNMAGFAFITQLGHIAHNHHAIARHLRQDLHGRRHGADVSVVGVIQQKFVFSQLDREKTPRHGF